MSRRDELAEAALAYHLQGRQRATRPRRQYRRPWWVELLKRLL